MKKKFLFILLTLVLCLTLAPAALAAGESPTQVTDETGLRTAVTSGGNIQLTQDITLTSTLTITGTVTIDLNGHVLKLNSSMYGGDATGSVIQVGTSSAKGTLTLKDSAPSTTHNFVEDATTGLWIPCAASGCSHTHKIVYGGVITGGSSSTGGGGIFNSNGTFTMSGGNIVGNTAQSGGGVYVKGANSTFTMTGGTISGNTAKGNGNPGCGGGVAMVSGSTFTMSGTTAKIAGNTATSTGTNPSGAGGGVYVTNGASVTMSGGTIGGSDTNDKNTAITSGGGVYVTNGASVTMSGDTTSITGNSTTGNGGGVYIAAPDSAAGTFTMNGGTIAQNTSKCGGGVYVNAYGTNKGELIMTAGSICGNTATESGGGVHVQGGSFTMSGGSIGGTTEADKNTAQSGGGGVYQNGGSFNMSGIASITGNMVTGEGGGVYMSGGSFTMTGGSVTGNTARNHGGGGVYMSSGSFTMSGTATISGNSANTNGGGVYICAENAVGTFTMEGGEIFGNRANNRGGGVSMYGLDYAAHFTMTGGSITGNSANDRSSNAAGGGVLADGDNNSTFTVFGDVTIKDNVKSGDLTNGVYTGDKADNVLLDNANDTISVSGALSDTASIGVTTATAPAGNSPVQFAKGTSVGNGYTLTKSDKKAFFPDLGTTGYYVSLNTTANTLSLNAGTAPHDHEWAYTLSEDKKTITATCEGTEGTCNFTGNTVLTIVKPALTVYGGSESAAATIADSKSTIGEVTSLPAIQYAKKTNGVYGTAGTSAPTNAGEYKASITVGDKTAYVEYTIAKATPTAGDFSFNAPTVLTYDGNAKNATVTSSKNGMGAVTVKYFKGGEVVSEAKNAGAYTVKIDVAVSDNYDSVSNLTVEGWSFTIQPKSLVESMVTVTSSLTYTGSAQSPTVTVKDGDKTLTVNTDYTLSGDTSKTNAGNYSISVTGTGNYTGTISNKTWSITKANLTDVSVTQNGALTYNGSAQSAIVTENATAKGGQTVTFTYCDTANGDYSETVPAFTDAGLHTVYYKASAPNHNDTTDNFTVVIDPKPISVTGATATDRSYGANSRSVEISGVTFEGATLTKGTDYTATGTMTDADAGTDKTVTVTVALSNANYTLASNTTTTTVNISKIAYSGTKNNKTVNIVKNRITAQNGSLGLSDFLGLELPAEAKFTSVTPANGTMMDSVSVTDSTLSYSSKTNIAAADDEDYTVTISTKNYEDFTVKLTFHSIDKTSVTITGLTAATGLTYDGAAKTGCTGTPNIVDHNDLVSALEYSYVGRDGTSYTSTTPPTNAGKYTLTVKVPDSDPNYTGSVSFDFEIKPKPVTVKPKAFIITRGAAIPVFALEYTGLVEGESLTPSTAPTFTCVESDNTTAVSASTAAGTYTITWTNKDSVSFTNANYTVTKEATATLTISNPHYTGGSGFPSSSTSTTTKNPDGSTTTTTKDTNGVIGTTITDKNGNVTDISAKIPASAANNGKAVTLPIDEVKPENGTTIDLDVPVGGATVKIPVEKPTAGTVVVIVDKDGTETVIPGSKVTENGIVVTLAENAAIKVIDNSKTFDDVKPGEYFSEPVQWASARKITVGISATSFGPQSSCTRAQLVTFLWRAAGQPKAGGESGMTDVANDTFYTDAVAWAVESGIVVGYGNGQFGSDDTITREQMAVILYRFAQKVGMDTTQSGTAVQEFNDYDSISEYALSAMQWAVNAGIMQGYANNLMPGQPCTRAQIVTMMYRLLGA